MLVPAGDPGFVKAFFVAGGRVAAERTLPPGGGAALEVEAGLAAARRAGELDLDELLLVDSFLRRPPPELRTAPPERMQALETMESMACPRRFSSSKVNLAGASG